MNHFFSCPLLLFFLAFLFVGCKEQQEVPQAPQTKATNITSVVFSILTNEYGIITTTKEIVYQVPPNSPANFIHQVTDTLEMDPSGIYHFRVNFFNHHKKLVEINSSPLHYRVEWDSEKSEGSIYTYTPGYGATIQEMEQHIMDSWANITGWELIDNSPTKIECNLKSYRDGDSTHPIENIIKINIPVKLAP